MSTSAEQDLSIGKLKGLFIETPLISKVFEVQCNDSQRRKLIRVHFKLENHQPSGSFKDRGIGHMIAYICSTRAVDCLVTSSGGNAGHAVAMAGQKLNIPVHVYVPTTTKALMINKIKKTGANVIVGGANWNEADSAARSSMTSNDKALYVPPFDDPLIWDGHTTMIDEIYTALNGVPPDEVVVSVGGGGLLAGVQRGLQRVGWNNTTIKAVETTGAASFAAAKSAGRVVSLSKIDTIATTLGALAVTPATLETSIKTESVVVTDEEAVTASCYFADDMRVLVEPACGASLSLIYLRTLRDQYFQSMTVDKSRLDAEVVKTVVVIVCGGGAVNSALISEWNETYVKAYESRMAEASKI